MTEYQTLASQQTKDWIDLANDLYGLSMSYPTVSFKLRGKTAGKAFVTRWEVRYNAVLLEENKEKFLGRTVPHEVAHLVARRLHTGRSIRPHGPEWKKIMRDFGVEFSRCHSYDVTNSTMRKSKPKHHYRCACRDHWLSDICHRRAQKGAGYYCKKCKATIEYMVDNQKFS